MKSYKDLEKICFELKNEIEKIYNLYGVELRLISFDNGQPLVIVNKEIKEIIDKIKFNLKSMFVVFNTLPKVSKKYYNVLNLYNYNSEKIMQLVNYFKSLSFIADGEYPFSLEAKELFVGSLNELCFDIIAKAFYDARSFNMKYQDNVNHDNFDIVKPLLFLSFDNKENIIDNNINRNLKK